MGCPPQVVAVDTLGAGDAFHGALAALLASGADLAAGVLGACEVAALRVSVAGARGWLSGVPALSGSLRAP